MIVKLASATATASQRVGSADGGTTISGIGDDRDRAHRGEMEPADCRGQQQRTIDALLHRTAAQPYLQRRRAEHPADHDGGRYQRRVPHDSPFDLEGGHAGVMHRGDTAAHDQPSERGGCRQCRRQRN